MKFPETWLRTCERLVADRNGAIHETESACEITTVSDAAPPRFAHRYEEEREETRSLQERRNRCRVGLFEK